jgi:hypothetical protein
VLQLAVGRVAVHNVAPPDAKVTVPPAPVGNPDSESVSAVPKATLAGAAASVKDVSPLTTAKFAPVAVVSV